LKIYIKTVTVKDMSCTKCGSKNNCHCSDNCPNKASDITTYDCNTLSAISVPCGASLCDVLGLLELYITNTASEVSVINDYLDITPHDLLVSGDPTTLISLTPAIGRLWDNQPIQNGMSIIHDDDNAYVQPTGVWTCPTTGRYDLAFAVKMSIDTGEGWYSSSSAGMIQAALVTGTGEDVYVGNTYASVNTQESAYISGAIGGYQLTAGDTVCLKIINTTGTSYSAITAGDFCRMSIRKV
jgi:hypothetical protein